MKPIEIIPLKEVVGHDRYDDVYEEFGGTDPHVVSKVEPSGNAWIIYCHNQTALKIEALSDRVIRFRYSLNGKFDDDYSYAVDREAVLSFDSHKNGRFLELSEKQSEYIFSNARMIITVQKDNQRVNIFNTNKQIICAEPDELTGGFYARRTLMKGVQQVKMTKSRQPDERFFGLGDKACALNLAGKKMENWTTDAYAYEANTDPLYKSVPFYYGLHDGRAYGIFFDNTYRTTFDFDSLDTGEVSFEAVGGEMNYYFIDGPALTDVARRYALLTGTPALPPLWALGFHQCRWSYYPEIKVLELAKTFREYQIPCDAIYLDIDYMDRFQCFTWDKNHFPDPPGMIRALKKASFQTVVMIDPGIKEDPEYDVYSAGVREDAFCKDADGDVFVGQVWPGACVFPDFTNPAVRTWWGGLYKKMYAEEGVSGFWNDMNEPANFKILSKTIPETVRHDYDGRPCSHKKAHNIYGLAMTRATAEGLLRLNPEKRPFLLTRATYSGGQKYAAVWTGDNVSSWEHLQIANRQVQRLSISGFSFAGSDIGGFADYPTGELMVRWLQLGSFHLFFRIHSMGANAAGDAVVEMQPSDVGTDMDRLDQEPWSFGEPYTSAARKAVELRYRLLPYLYSSFYEHTKTGTPVILPLSFYDQTDPEALDEERGFMAGRHLLVSPVIHPGVDVQSVYLPEGEWYDYYTDAKYTGKSRIEKNVDLCTIPLYVKAGAAIPHYPVMQHTGERVREILEIKIYYSDKIEESIIYEDQGDGYEYLKNQQDQVPGVFISDGTESGQFTIRKKGRSFILSPLLLIKLIGYPYKATECILDGKNILFAIKGAYVEVIIPSDFNSLIFR